MTNRVDVVVPDLGDFSDVEIIEILVKPGDRVEAEDSLLTLETEKAAMDVPAPAAGVISEISVAVGARVSSGDRVAVIDAEVETDGDSAAAAQSVEASPERLEASDAELASDGDSKSLGPVPVTVVVPDIGDFADVEVIDVLVAPGDEIEIEHGLVTLETEKAAMDVPATAPGIVREVLVAKGDRLSAGAAIAVVDVVQTAGAAAPVAAADQNVAAAAVNTSAPTSTPVPAASAGARTSARRSIDERGFAAAHASPSVRKLARELGVDLGQVRGSGRKGRVTATDVKAWVKSVMLGAVPTGPALPEVPTVDFARFGPVESMPLSRIQKISGPRLHASWVNLPHVTQHDDADITDLENKRQALKSHAAERGIKLTPLAFVMRACVLALEEFPMFRSSLSADGDSLVVKNYMHIGFAADTPNGLVVPVIRDADKKDVYELAEALIDLSGKAREGKLRADDMQGAVFTISSLGGIGGTYFTPIINAPEVAILGVSRNTMQPVFQENEFVPRLMLPLSLSYDHRVIDGAQAARFITTLSAILGDVDRLVGDGA